jgi:hypothetical protein
MHSFSLANSVRPILSLFVHSWVPISIEEDHTVRSRQVDSNTTASCARNEAEKLGLEVKPIDHLLALLYFDRAVEPDVSVAMQIQELLQNI